jgi:hypothetical protein
MITKTGTQANELISDLVEWAEIHRNSNLNV